MRRATRCSSTCGRRRARSARESRSYTVRLPGVHPQTIDEHHAIVEAIAAGDAAAAEAAMPAHIARIRGVALAQRAGD